MPRALIVQGPPCKAERGVPDRSPINSYPLVVIVGDIDFAARTLNNFLWVTFTRPSRTTPRL